MNSASPRFYSRLPRIFLTTALTTLTVLLASNAQAGIQYALEQSHAVPGETITVKAVLFNDTDSGLDWTPPRNLVLQWRNDQGQALRSLATISAGSGKVSVPVNNFVTFSWSAVVPASVEGLQAINIEGSPALLALDTNPQERSAVAGTPITAPVQVPSTQSGNIALANATDVAAAGVSAESGPAPDEATIRPASYSPFESFRNALSPHDPMYFLLGNKGGLNARFQLSFKFRPFSPSSPDKAGFMNHWYLGYTQTSLWDLSSDSMPFIDTTYNPSIFWQKDALVQSDDKRWFLGLTSGVEHKSNGKGGADSRSVNDVFIQPQFNYRFDGGSTLTFSPRVKAYFMPDDTTPNYRDYAGNVDWKLSWKQDNGLMLSGMYQQGKHGRNAVQIDAAWPLRRTILDMNGYLHVQYFQGYGMTLLDYRNKTSPQVRIGLSLVP